MVHKHCLTVLFIVSTLLAACAPQAVEPIPLETQPVEAPLPESASPTEIAPATEAPAVSSNWVSYRDLRFGVGLAYPCWWVFVPMSTEGIGGSMSLRSVDEEFVRTHSTKGNWNDGIVPEGVFSIDMGVFEQIDPALSTTDAWDNMTDPTMSIIVASEEQAIGQNQATVIQLQNVNNSNDPLITMYLFRLAPDKILMFSPLFQDRLDSNDIQGILSSLSLSPDQPIIMPTVTPHEPLIAAACVGK